MTSKNKPVFTPHAAPVPAPTAVGTDLPKHSPPSDFTSNVSDPSGLDPTTALTITSTVHSNTPTPVPDGVQPKMSPSLSFSGTY